MLKQFLINLKYVLFILYNFELINDIDNILWFLNSIIAFSPKISFFLFFIICV
jgi:hypothetical protein